MDFLWRHQFQNPVFVIRERMAAHLTRREDRLRALDQHDIIHLLAAGRLQNSLRIVDAWLQELCNVDMDTPLPFLPLWTHLQSSLYTSTA